MKKPVAEWGRLSQVQDGQVDRWKYREDGTAVGYEICCDCGLTHLVEYKPTRRYLRIRVWRDEERTKEMRRKKNAVHRKS